MQRTFRLIKSFGLGVVPLLKLRESLIQDAKLTQNYLVLTISSCVIATLGLLINSAAVIIGAMIIAPLILPLRGLPFATLEGDLKLLKLSFVSITVGTFLSIFCSLLVGIVLRLPDFGSEILSRTEPTLVDLLIAIFAGGVSGYAKIRPQLGDAIPGTAIAVALMPPICVVGLALSQGQWELASGATLLYITNLIGINLACIGIYVLGGYARSNELARTLSWGTSIALISMLAIPLGISFWRFSSHAHVNQSVNKILVGQSLTDRPDIQIDGSKINWRKKPPVVLVTVRTTDPITPGEVALVEQVLTEELSTPFKVIFDVTPATLIESNRPQPAVPQN
ncbi:MAG: TIGR00341 family protein [Microcoleaceae cyanobacterium]